ncbi:MAG: hypothetical protein HC860_12930 [Alkalinema sp. RU_4_3]|nr:hypothetical protein [Alkalinema sp. RU_4_3]
MIDFNFNEREDILDLEFAFSDLQDLLRAEVWKAADQKTYRILMESKTKKNLQVINRLWQQTSDGHFGFRVQQQIYFECGGKPEDLINIRSKGFAQDWYHGPWIKFAKTLGWTKTRI